LATGLVRGLQPDRQGGEGGERQVVPQHPVADDRRRRSRRLRHRQTFVVVGKNVDGAHRRRGRRPTGLTHFPPFQPRSIPGKGEESLKLKERA